MVSLGSPNIKLLGVLDGHGGEEASSFASSALPEAVLSEFETHAAGLDDITDDDARAAVERALVAAFEKVGSHMCSDESEFASVGTTATLAALCPSRQGGSLLHVANIGDRWKAGLGLEQG